MTQQQNNQPHDEPTPAEPETGVPHDEDLPQGGATPDAGLTDADGEPVEMEVDDQTALENEIAALQTQNEQLRQDYLRALAEAQNASRMADKRIKDNAKYALSNFVKELLPVADNLSRALSAAPDDARQEGTPMNTLLVGVEMTEQSLLAALEKHGVTRISSENEPFDPHRHQAMQEVDKTDVPNGTVVQVYQEGYMIADRLLRPAMVVVSKGGPKREAPPEGNGHGGNGGGIDQTV